MTMTENFKVSEGGVGVGVGWWLAFPLICNFLICFLGEQLNRSPSRISGDATVSNEGTPALRSSAGPDAYQ